MKKMRSPLNPNGDPDEKSDVETTGHDTSSDIAPEPQAEMAADPEIIGDVVADDPQRDHDLTAPGLERGIVLAVDQRAEDLAAVGFAVLGAQYHPVRPGAELCARGAVVVVERRHQ